MFEHKPVVWSDVLNWAETEVRLILSWGWGWVEVEWDSAWVEVVVSWVEVEGQNGF